ncbi:MULTISPECIES: ABC transporter ATP-binding protein [Microbacterium]|uniref:ABC transporter ATP-binding protein n=1 Tax=Microbacterium TaxID=33882 RepID=UPI0009DDB9DC|nr:MULTISPECIES: ABC transporter ATP-binding protein [unclassified Microbacterium]
MSLVALEDVTKSVLLADDSRLEILRGITLEVGAGDHVSIVGRSGSGKSTLLNILGMLDSPTSGSVSFEGREVRRMRSGRLDRLRGDNVGFVFQQFNLLPGRTALDNVMMPLGHAKGKVFWNRRQIAADMLERVGLGHRVGQIADKLSGGEQQRVAIARALVRRPVLILADEPTGALDIDTGASVMSLLDEVATETDAALVTITHDLHVAARARRHYRLDAGRLETADLSRAFEASTLAASVPSAPAPPVTVAPAPPVAAAPASEVVS